MIGTGQLGGRYLQGLAKLKTPIAIDAFDLDPSALEEVSSIWQKSIGRRQQHSLELQTNFCSLKRNIDLVIVSTSSSKRPELVERTIEYLEPTNVILEKVLCQNSEGAQKIARSVEGKCNAWVNTPRRIMTWHKNIRKHLRHKGPLAVKKTAHDWGLACNAIHFIDLVCWWTGESLKRVSCDGLEERWFESARRGYFDIRGTLYIEFSGGSSLELNSLGHSCENILSIDCQNGERWKIFEEEGLAVGPNSQVLNGALELQSDMTESLVERILAYNECDLTSIQESVRQHIPFLNSLLQHWNKTMMRNDQGVPIT